MGIRIHRIKKSFKAEMGEYQVPEELLARASAIAEQITRPELVLFWLKIASERSEDSFNSWFRDIPKFSQQELVNIIHELETDALKRFVREFEKKTIWSKEEWEKFRKKFEDVSLEKLKRLADVTGLKFFAKNIGQEDYINTLDESDKKELMGEYEKIVSNLKRKQ